MAMPARPNVNTAVFALLLLVVCPAGEAKAALPDMKLTAKRILVAEFSLEQFEMTFAAAVGIALTVGDVSRLNGQPELHPEMDTLGPVRLNCPGQLLHIMNSGCSGGVFSLGPALISALKLPRLSGTLGAGRVTADSLRMEAHVQAAAVVFSVLVVRESGPLEITVNIPAQPIASVSSLLDEFNEDTGRLVDGSDGQASAAGLVTWVRTGTLEGQIESTLVAGSPPEAQFRLAVGELSFDSPDGQYAAEGMALSLQGSLSMESGVRGAIRLDLHSGELLLGDFYRNFADASLQIDMQPAWQDDQLTMEAIHLSDGGSLELLGHIEAFVPSGPAPRMHIEKLSLVFPDAYTRYLESVAAKWTLDRLETRGVFEWQGVVDLDPAAVLLQTRSMSLISMDVGDSDQGRFAVTGLDVTIETDDFHFGAMELLESSQIRWDALQFGPIHLGSAAVGLIPRAGGFGISEPLNLEILGGQLSIQELAFSRQPGQATDIQLQANLEGLDMALLTAAFGWPELQGEISGRIPGIGLKDGIVSVDGELDFSVFGGKVVLGDFRIERAFGVLPSLAASIDATSLDLELLTSTFEFGQISGRLDGYVHDLRMLDWRPVSFDAWLGTPEGKSRSSEISRQAVNHLTSIGGGGATAVLTGPVLKLFNNFSYRRLGMGCRMQNNVCDVSGLDDNNESVLIMEGAGIPKIMIRAFNRRLDWPQLVAELLAASGDEKIRIGD